MITAIQPTTTLNNGVTGFWFTPTLFVPMIPHSGKVALIPTKSGKGCGYRFTSLTEANSMFTDDRFSLEVRCYAQPRMGEIMQIAAARGRRLVVVFNDNPQKEH